MTEFDILILVVGMLYLAPLVSLHAYVFLATRNCIRCRDSISDLRTIAGAAFIPIINIPVVFMTIFPWVATTYYRWLSNNIEDKLK